MKSPKIPFFSPGLVSLQLFFALSACTHGEKTGTQGPKIVKEDEAGPWADSLIQKLSDVEKAGQLILITVNNSEEVEQAENLLAEKKIGGVILGRKLLKDPKKICVSLLSASEYPIWIGAEMNEDFYSDNRLPDLLSLGSCKYDSVLEEWGTTTAELLHSKGINLVFFSSSRLSPEGNYFRDSPGASEKEVSQKSISLHKGLRKGGIMICERPLPDPSDLYFPKNEKFPVFRRSLNQLVNHEMQAFCALVPEDLNAVQLANFTVTGTDSKQPMSISKKVIIPLFRDNLEFKGIIFSGNLNDSNFNYSSSDKAFEKNCLDAGVEVLVNPRDPGTAANNISDSLKGKKYAGRTFDQLVKKVLLARAKTVRDFSENTLSNSQDFDYQLELLRRKVYSSSIIFLRNNNHMLPLGHVETEKVASLSIGVNSRTAFQNSLDSYMDMDHFLLSKGASGENYDSRLAQLSKYQTVIISLHNDIHSQKEDISPELIHFIKQLQLKTHCVIVHFGHPLSLDGLDPFPSLIQSSDGGTLSQELSAQIVFGAAPVNGILPADASHSFCAGDGINSKTIWRLRYNVLPEEAGISSKYLERADSIVKFALNSGAFPGCQVLIARDSKVIYNKAFGFQAYDHEKRVSRSDLYDIASVTKMAATTLSVMAAFDRDSLKLDGTLKDYIPGFDTTKLKNVVIEDLLIHEAGLPPALPVYWFYTVKDSTDSLKTKYYSTKPDTNFKRQIAKDFYFSNYGMDSVLKRVALVKPHGRGHYEYSDLGFYLLKRAVEGIFETRLDTFVYDNFYQPLGLKHILFNPLRKFSIDQICPTEDDKWFRKQLVHGYVHDQAAALIGGISGHAGIFSDAQDLGVIMQLLLNKGIYGGKRYFKEKTVELFTSRHRECYRGLGFDKQTASQDYTMVCSSASPDCFGHTGFTGTCVWADPRNGIVYIFLSNRVNPDAKNQKINIYGVRQAIQQVIYEAIDAMNPRRDNLLSGEPSLLSQGDSLENEENDTVVP